MAGVSLAQLRAFAPHGAPHILQAIADHAADAFARHGLTSLARVRMFLAQTAEESGGYTALEENLHYSAARAHAVWPRLFPSAEAAAPFVADPRAFAEKVYGGRRDLGNTQAGDGWRYRGMGLLQTTGRGWAVKLQALTGLPLVDQPELAVADATMLEVACANFASYPGILEACDRGDLVAVTHMVNGAEVNLDTRRAWLERARATITAPQETAPVATASSARAAPPPVPPPPVPASAAPASAAPETPTGAAALQADLNRLGAAPPLRVDGAAGPATRFAVRAFQVAHGLVVDGRAGPRTMAAIAAALSR